MTANLIQRPLRLTLHASDALPDGIIMLSELLTIQRIRSADARLIKLLQWITRSFGQVNSYGCRLSLSELNLTHRQLAKLCGLTRVTATKIFSRFRLGGQLLAVGESDLLIPSLP